ncbi:hypothetical protein KP509_08G040600 [Ceratopteris richardii]|uniref:Glycosyltransferase n=1 Tax=Ceratopteris richardii TaxID=49495 RepID=A0A8T2U9T4_CERRI|nr:hypothetical protein KP509_08G040600 [Ceratopteris richardii]
MDIITESAELGHVLVLPFPAQGHINPFLSFSKRLAASGFIITFMLPAQAYKLVQQTASHVTETGEGTEEMKKTTLVDEQECGLNIRFEAYPDGSEPLPGIHPDCDPLKNLFLLLEDIEAQKEFIEDVVVKSRDTPHPITCIISDSFLAWTSSLALKLGVQRIFFWSSNGASLATLLWVHNGKLNSTDGGLPADIPVAQSELLSHAQAGQPEVIEKFVTGIVNSIKHSTCIVVNTFEQLERWSLTTTRALCEADVHYVGPLIKVGKEKTARSFKFYAEDASIITWLDKQVPGSVLYISFGSLVSLTQPEIEELAAGVEQSKRPFLWVLRHKRHLLPHGFQDRTRGEGLVVNWAPQTEILEHAAVGGFLTHCGWNSVLESIHSGVPMVCYPLIHDQYSSALLISKEWKLGYWLQKEADMVTRAEIQRGISSVFTSEEIRQSLSLWKTWSHRALERGGSSDSSTQKFISTLKKLSASTKARSNAFQAIHTSNSE